MSHKQNVFFTQRRVYSQKISDDAASFRCHKWHQSTAVVVNPSKLESAVKCFYIEDGWFWDILLSPRMVEVAREKLYCDVRVLASKTEAVFGNFPQVFFVGLSEVAGVQYGPRYRQVQGPCLGKSCCFEGGISVGSGKTLPKKKVSSHREGHWHLQSALLSFNWGLGWHWWCFFFEIWYQNLREPEDHWELIILQIPRDEAESGRCWENFSAPRPVVVGVLRSSSEAEEPDLWHCNCVNWNWAEEIGKFIGMWVDILPQCFGCYLIRSGNRDRRDLNETEQANTKENIDKEQPFLMAVSISSWFWYNVPPKVGLGSALGWCCCSFCFSFRTKKDGATGATRPKRVNLVIENASTRCLAWCICRLMAGSKSHSSIVPAPQGLPSTKYCSPLYYFSGEWKGGMQI